MSEGYGEMPHIPPSLGLNMGRCMVILGVKSKCNVCSANTRIQWNVEKGRGINFNRREGGGEGGGEVVKHKKEMFNQATVGDNPAGARWIKLVR